MKINKYLKTLLKKILPEERYIDRITKFLPGGYLVLKELGQHYERTEIDYNHDVHMIFFCGIGDAMYGLGTILQIRGKCDAHGVKLIAHCSTGTKTMANSMLADFFREFSIFDEIHTFVGYETEYWKYFDWRLALFGRKNAKAYPFIYSTDHRLATRIDGISKRFKEAVDNDRTWVELFKFKKSRAYTRDELKKQITFTSWLASSSKNTVLCHFDSRSGNYKYKYAQDVVDAIIEMGLRVVLVDDVDISGVRSEDNFIIRPSDFRLPDLMTIMKEYHFRVVAVNSVFWPISDLLELTTLGIHFLQSRDGHHFYHKNMSLITSDAHTAGKVRSKRGHVFELHEAMWEKTNHPSFIEVKPEIIIQHLNYIR